MKRALFLFSLLSTGAFALNLELSGAYLSQDPSGILRYPRDGGTSVSVDGDLGIGKDSTFMVRGKLELPVVPNLYLAYTPTSFSGTGTLSYNVTYGGTTFDSTANVSSSLEVKRLDGILYYNLSPIEKLTGGVLAPELGLGVRYFDLKGSVTGRDVNTGLTVTETASEKFPLPVLYASLSVGAPTHFLPLVDRVSLYGEGKGIAYSNSKYYNLVFELRFHTDKLFVFGGYSLEKLKVDEADVDLFADIEIKGVMVGGGFAF